MRARWSAQVFSSVLFVSIANPLTIAFAQVQSPNEPDRKAIIIGINCYDPTDANRPDCERLKDVLLLENSTARFGALTSGAWLYWHYPNLSGAVSDATMMKAILESRGFTVPPDAFLVDGQATASAILKALRKYLIDDTRNAKPGDVRFVYYSGHGNYVRNLAVTDQNDPDRFDETMVPSDHWRGTADIRDKELSRIFTEASKQVKIVFVADSCHSGSLSRGPGGMAKTAISGSADDEKAPKITDKAPPDASRKNGLITLAAARRDQVALETVGVSDSITDAEAGPHGAFTWALRQALIGDMDAPLDRLFQRASALLAVDKPNQIPNLDGLNTNQFNLFGDKVTDGGFQTVVAGAPNGEDIPLRGGRAIGIYKDTELTRVTKGGASVVIRVTQEDGIEFSHAKIVEHGPGNFDVRKGDVFRVNKWVVPAQSMLSVYIPPAISPAALRAAVTEFGKLATGLGANWIEDETIATPTHILRWDGKAWLLEKGDFEESGANLGTAPTAVDVQKQLPPGAKLFVALPPAAELTDQLPFGKADKGRVLLAKSSGTANYRLRGRIHGGGAEYAWIQPAASVLRSKGTLDKLELPVRTDWMPIADLSSMKELASRLGDQAYKLGRLREWQTLPTVGSASGAFPYHLEFRDVATGKPVDSGGAFGGKQYKIFLKANAGLKPTDSVTPRYTYVFAIDQFGKGTLLWPILGQGNQDNLFPAPVAAGEKKPPTPLEIPVSGKADYDFEVGGPYGNDAYLLLTSVERLDNPDILDFDGVRTEARSARGVIDNPLADLLGEVGSLSRGPVRRVPTDWSLETTILHSSPPQ